MVVPEILVLSISPLKTLALWPPLGKDAFVMLSCCEEFQNVLREGPLPPDSDSDYYYALRPLPPKRLQRRLGGARWRN